MYYVLGNRPRTERIGVLPGIAENFMSRRTILNEIKCEGVALHAGSQVHMTLGPARGGSGIVFRRSDLGGREIRASWDKVTETKLGTVIADASGMSVGVIEYLMAAVAGAEVDDLAVTLDGPEPPILDGDALSFLDLLEEARFHESLVVRRGVRVLKPIKVEREGAFAALEPADDRILEFDIQFDSPAIGKQRLAFVFTPGRFRMEIAPARTFGFLSELDALNKVGLAKGASLENTLAIEGDTIVNAERMRFADEFVRHKILDAMGDLALAGGPLIGRFVGHRSGHALNNALLRTLFADAANFAWVEI